MKHILLLAAGLALLASGCGLQSSRPGLLLVSTTSTQDSGLLDVLLPAFEQQSGYHVMLVAVGSGQALQMGAEGNADVILPHSPAAEETFMANGFGIDRRLVMHNDFVLVGPASDPARVRGRTPVTALQAIYTAKAAFVSRGDDSGTNVKELALWKSAGLDLAGQPWYIETGQGQGATLTIASEKEAYALTDRATFLAYHANLDTEILVEGDPNLLNVYHVITVNPARWPEINLAGARAFADFITSPAGQAIIRDFGLEQYGQPLFFPDAGRDDSDLGL